MIDMNKMLLTSLLTIGITGACINKNEQDNKINLLPSNHPNYVVELGNALPNADQLIDVNETSKKMQDANKRIEYEKECVGVGTYNGTIIVSNKNLPFKIQVVDTTCPKLILNETKLSFSYGYDLSNYDFKNHIKVDDLSSTTVNVTHSIDTSKAGVYEVIIEVMDDSKNTTKGKIEVEIKEPMKNKIIKKNSLVSCDSKKQKSTMKKNKYNFTDKFTIVDYQDSEHWTMEYYGDWHYVGSAGGSTFYAGDLLPLPDDVIEGRVTID